MKEGSVRGINEILAAIAGVDFSVPEWCAQQVGCATGSITWTVPVFSFGACTAWLSLLSNIGSKRCMLVSTEPGRVFRGGVQLRGSATYFSRLPLPLCDVRVVRDCAAMPKDVTRLGRLALSGASRRWGTVCMSATSPCPSPEPAP